MPSPAHSPPRTTSLLREFFSVPLRPITVVHDARKRGVRGLPRRRRHGANADRRPPPKGLPPVGPTVATGSCADDGALNVDPQEMGEPLGLCAASSCSFLGVSGRQRFEPPRHRLPDVSCSVDVTREPNPGVADDATSFRRRNHVSCRRWHRQQGWLGRYPLFPIFFLPLSLPPSHPSSRSFHFFLEQKTGERRALLALMEPVTTRDCVLNIFPC